MPVQLDYTLTFNDYLHAQWLHGDRRWRNGFVQVMNTRILPGFGLLLIVLGLAASRNWVVVGLGLLLMSYPLLLRLYFRYCYRATRSEGECKIEFNQDLIRTSTTNTKGEVQWAAIRSFSEDKKIFLLYIAPAKFFVIPKRVCSEEQINELRCLFHAQVVAKAG